MKYLIIISCLLLTATSVQAQEQAPVSVNARILQKMADSLSLNAAEILAVDSVNNHISFQKALARQQHTDMDSLTKYIQLAERSRDSLYRIVLREEKFQLYLPKKTNLIR